MDVRRLVSWSLSVPDTFALPCVLNASLNCLNDPNLNTPRLSLSTRRPCCGPLLLVACSFLPMPAQPFVY